MLGEDIPGKSSSKCVNGPKLADSTLRYCDQCDTQVQEGSWPVKKAAAGRIAH